MIVRAKISFVGSSPDGKKFRVSAGDTLTLPKGVDWLKVGLLEEVPEKKKRGKANKGARTKAK